MNAAIHVFWGPGFPLQETIYIKDRTKEETLRRFKEECLLAKKRSDKPMYLSLVLDPSLRDLDQHAGILDGTVLTQCTLNYTVYKKTWKQHWREFKNQLLTSYTKLVILWIHSEMERK